MEQLNQISTSSLIRIICSLIFVLSGTLFGLSRFIKDFLKNGPSMSILFINEVNFSSSSNILAVSSTRWNHILVGQALYQLEGPEKGRSVGISLLVLFLL